MEQGRRFGLGLLVLLAAGAIDAAPDAESCMAILDDTTLWRHFHVSGASTIRAEDGKSFRAYIDWDAREQEEPHNEKVALPKGPDDHPLVESPVPPTDWASPAFDDSVWANMLWPQPVMNQRYCANSPQGYERVPYHTIALFARGKFQVKDPAQVKMCTLSLDYWGGVIVYVNGKELVRGDMPEGAVEVNAVSKEYPDDAFCRPDGKLMRNDDEKNAERHALRNRQLRDVQIPAARLQKGVNVIAIEAHQAPVSAKINKGIGWVPVGLIHAQVTVAPGSAASAPGLKGVRLWNVAAYDTVTAFDYGISGELLRPIVIRAARNSVFSGRLMVGSDQPIKGLKATVSDLAQADGASRIPAAAVRVRYAVQATPDKSWVPVHRFDGLLDSIPAEIPVSQAKALPAMDYYHLRIDRPAPVPGALVPLWFTVRVPRDAKAGVYEGKVTVSAEGLAATAVPLRVNVCDWVLPDPQDFRVQNRLYHAEEVEARFYVVPSWSDKHLERIGKSLALLNEVGSRQVQVNLALEFSGNQGGGNSESLVRWIKQPDGSYKHDYTVFDKFLDMVAKSMGKPANLRLNCWGDPGGGANGSGPIAVSELDPVTGKISPLKQPPLGSAENLAFWQPVFAEVLEKLRDRGWLDVATLGYLSFNTTPSPAMVDVAYKLWPEGEWSYASHASGDDQSFVGTTSNVVMKVRCSDAVWSRVKEGKPPLYTLDKARRYSLTTTVRHVYNDSAPLREMRRFVEYYTSVQGGNNGRSGYDGVSEFGADLFPLKRPAGGFFQPPAGRGTHWAEGNPPDTISALLYPGPDGPVATERYEMFREGLELSEAALFVRNALHNRKLSGDLEQRAKEYLFQCKDDRYYTGGERSKAFGRAWFAARHMQAVEDAKLLDLAGEVAGAEANK